jgi:hypothetical protein
VDGLEGGHLRLTRGDDPGAAGEHRFLPLRLVAACEGGQVRLTLPAQDARAVAFGALRIGEEDEVAAPQAGQVSNRTGAREPNMVGQAGGGTTRHGHLGSGSGIPDDPNMNPSAAKNPGA